MSVLNSNPFLIASGSPTDPTFPLQRSVRLRSSASAYFNRTFSVTGNQKIWTWSSWHKICEITNGSILFQQYNDASNQSQMRFGGSASQSRFYDLQGAAFVCDITWTPVYRDPSAWYHVVFVVDTTQATNTDRIKFYINGVQITATASAAWPAQNSNLRFNGNNAHFMNQNGAGSAFGDSYRTEINFVDGQALTPSSFGGYNSGTGVWEPRKYTGTYGTNGFYLNFQDNSGATATTIGKDSSGNGNNWTPNNISVTAGVTYDSMLDVPTNTSATNANFATLNPVNSYATGISNANLKFADGAGVVYQAYSTISNPDIATYKFYCEVTVDTGYGVGIAVDTKSGSNSNTDRTGVLSYYANGQKYNGATGSAYGATFTANDIIGIAMGNGQVEFFKNGTSQGVAFTSLTGAYKFAVWAAGATGVGCNFNFGQRPFSYTPPSGFKSLNTYNLPEPTIPRGDKYFKQYLYTGNGGGQQVGEIQKPLSLYNLDRSLRFRSAASANLSRTPASAGNRQIFTYSIWLKRGALGSRMSLLDGFSAAAGHVLELQADNALEFYAWGTGAVAMDVKTTQVFRDPSAWYHIVIAVDTTQATAANRVKMYINGEQITSFSVTTYPSQNSSLYINNNIVHNIGRRGDAQFYFDGYLADVYFIDGQALAPTSFGTYDGNNYWTPKAYTGTYGTNGFHLEFEDYSAATATAIGKDTSGQGNNWTPSGINVTTPANTNASWDSMTDVPTLTSTDVANFCVIDRLRSNTGITISDANLKAAITSSSQENLLCTLGVSSGKWYWEVTSTFSGADLVIGVVDGSVGTTRPTITNTAFQVDLVDGRKWNGGSAYTYTSAFTSGDTLGIALDLDAGSITFYKNGVSQGVAFTGIPNKTWYPSQWKDGASASYTSNYNFGQRPFRYTPPTGYKTLNSFNVAEVLGDVETPDFVWIKSRSAATGHALFNSVTGVGKYLSSNATTAETTDVNSLIQFNKNGFLLGNAAIVNTSAATYVASAWKGGGAAITNTAGSITSQVSANPSAGFSIVTYTGTGANATVGHGLGVAPKMVIVKSRNNAGSIGYWAVWHTSIPNTDYLLLQSTDAKATSSLYWNSTSPTSTVFSLGSGTTPNASTATYVAYCFSEIAGFSKFGLYTGTGNTDGQFVYTGFRPRLIITKQTGAISNWSIHDSTRAPYNLTINELYADTSDVEYTGANDSFDLLSNGFKPRSAGTPTNASGGTYIYIAFAESPFKYSLGR